MASLSLVLAGFLLTGCPEKPPEVSQDSLLLMVASAEDVLEGWQIAARAFEKEAGVPVVVQSVTSDKYPDRLEQALRGPRPPDVFALDSTRLPEFAARGVLLGLDSYVAQDKDLKPQDYYPVAWEAYQYQGQCYGLPYELHILAMLYNEEHLDAQFLGRPAADWTWQDYLDLARKLTRDRDDDGRTDTYGTALCPWWQVHVWQNGGDLVDDPANPRRSTLSTPEAREALQWLADLSLKHHAAPPYSITSTMDAADLFLAQRVSMTYAGRWTTRVADSKAQFTWGHQALPRGKTEANLGTGMGLCLRRGATQPEKAFRLAAYISAGGGQETLQNGGFTCPAYRPVAETPVFERVIGQTHNAYYEGLKVARPVPATPRYAEIAKVWEEELAKLWSGEAGVDEVTKRIDERVDRLLGEGQPATAWLRGLVPMG